MPLRNTLQTQFDGTMRIAFVILVLFLLTQCDGDSISGLSSGDQFVLNIDPGNASYSALNAQLHTEKSYGCEGKLSYRFFESKGVFVFDVIGISKGNSGCTGQPAQGKTHNISYTTETEFTVEIRYRKKVDRFKIQRNGRTWSHQAVINQLGSTLLINAN